MLAKEKNKMSVIETHSKYNVIININIFNYLVRKYMDESAFVQNFYCFSIMPTVFRNEILSSK